MILLLRKKYPVELNGNYSLDSLENQMSDPVTQRLSLTIYNELADGTIVVRNVICSRYDDLSKLCTAVFLILTSREL